MFLIRGFLSSVSEHTWSRTRHHQWVSRRTEEVGTSDSCRAVRTALTPTVRGVCVCVRVWGARVHTICVCMCLHMCLGGEGAYYVCVCHVRVCLGGKGVYYMCVCVYRSPQVYIPSTAFRLTIGDFSLFLCTSGNVYCLAFLSCLNCVDLCSSSQITYWTQNPKGHCAYEL